MATKASAKKKKQPTAKKERPLPQYLPLPRITARKTNCSG